MILRLIVLSISLAVPVASPSLAEATQSASIELNRAETTGDSCRLTFTVQSDPGLASLRMETVLFDAAGGVMMLTLFDFQDVPAGKLRVRQFDIPGMACASLGRLLFNGTESCVNADGGACAAPVRVGSRSEIEVLG